ncbi:MAG: hypothetical protein PHH30_08710 [Bacteroidales bacterium]|nr:hypothetical protein [Bacteroidales bacterium]MDD3860793.1 hypothetical protein [Bacteroidales bacterium]
MTERIIQVVLLIVFTSTGFAQEDSYYLNAYDNKLDTGKMQFRGMFGYYYVSGEFVRVDTTFFTELFNNKGIPTVNPESAFQIGSLGFMFNRLYSNFSYSYTLDKEKEKDSLKSVLRQSSYSLTFGYNIFRKKWEWKSISKKDSNSTFRNFTCVISPFIGIKTFRLRHITSNNEKSITFQQYFEKPGYDLRIIQFSCPVGINMTFNFNDRYSFGFYVSYLYHLNEYPIIKSPQDRISNTANLPIKNLYFGLGCGVGWNDFYKKKAHNKSVYLNEYDYNN